MITHVRLFAPAFPHNALLVRREFIGLTAAARNHQGADIQKRFFAFTPRRRFANRWLLSSLPGTVR
jgi:hypothetical protein